MRVGARSLVPGEPASGTGWLVCASSLRAERILETSVNAMQGCSQVARARDGSCKMFAKSGVGEEMNYCKKLKIPVSSFNAVLFPVASVLDCICNIS